MVAYGPCVRAMHREQGLRIQRKQEPTRGPRILRACGSRSRNDGARWEGERHDTLKYSFSGISLMS